MIAAYPPAQTRVVHRVGCGYGGCGWTVLGYVLSRGPGLPNYTDDIRNWAEPLGVASLAVETALLALSVPPSSPFVGHGRQRPPYPITAHGQAHRTLNCRRFRFSQQKGVALRVETIRDAHPGMQL
jgi:hypothetical protein